MRSALARTDDFLRATGPFSLGHLGHERPGWWLPVMILAFSPIYGAAMGSFQFDAPARTWQVVFSASKMPLLLFATSGVVLAWRTHPLRTAWLFGGASAFTLAAIFHLWLLP